MAARPVFIERDTEDDTEDIIEIESARSPSGADSEQPIIPLSETSIVQLLDTVPSEVAGRPPHRFESHEDISRQINDILEVARQPSIKSKSPDLKSDHNRSQTPQSQVSEDDPNGSSTQAVTSYNSSDEAESGANVATDDEAAVQVEREVLTATISPATTPIYNNSEYLQDFQATTITAPYELAGDDIRPAAYDPVKWQLAACAEAASIGKTMPEGLQDISVQDLSVHNTSDCSTIDLCDNYGAASTVENILSTVVASGSEELTQAPESEIADITTCESDQGGQDYDGSESNIDPRLRTSTSQEAGVENFEGCARGDAETRLSRSVKRQRLVLGPEQAVETGYGNDLFHQDGGLLNGSEQTDAVYEEWPVRGSFKRVQIGEKTVYSIEFSLKQLPDRLTMSLTPKDLDTTSSSSSQLCAAHSPPSAVHPEVRKRMPWTLEEENLILHMKEQQGCSWKEIARAVPLHSQASIQVRYSTKLNIRVQDTFTSRRRRQPKRGRRTRSCR